MAVTQTQYTGNGNTVLYSFTFPYLATTDVKVKINGVTQPTTAYSLANATTVQMNSAPANGATVLIFRDTDNDNKKATFYPGSAIKAEDLNDNIDQILYVAQEVDNNAMSTLGDDAMQGDLSLGTNKITNLGNPTSGTDAVNKTTLDSTIDTAIESDVLVGTDLSKSASGGQVTISHNVSGANTTINNSGGNVVQDITISAQGHVTSAGSVDLDNRYYTETELDAGQLDNRYFTETELSGGQLNNLYYTETELDGGQLDNRYFTETELNNGALDNRYFTEAELNNGQLDTRYFRQDSSETITSGATWSGSDNFIATTAAIDARIVDLVDDVGGFVPIANETSFPATNPDVNNGTGTLVSIKSIASARTPSGGSVVITDGAGSGNDVTITGLGTTVLPAGYGVIVETTGTTHTYTFHRLSPDATSVTAVSAIPNEIATVAGISSHVQTVSGINNDVQVVGANNSSVTTVAGSISSVNTAASNLDQIQNFANVYRIVSSDPSTSLNTGDLIYNTTTDKFKVYTGSAWVDAVARQFSDNTKMQFGDGNDLQIYHDGSHSIIEDTGTGNLFLKSDSVISIRGTTIALKNAANTETLLSCVQDGAVQLYFDGSKKFETYNGGVKVYGDLIINDNENIYLGDGADLEIRVGSNNDGVINQVNGDLKFQKSGSGKFTLKSTGTHFSDDAFWADSQKAIFGAGSDLQIYHDGNNSKIVEGGTGGLVLQTSKLNVFNAAGTEEILTAPENGAVNLYFDGSKKLETQSGGAKVSGLLTVDGNLISYSASHNSLGLAGHRWNDLFIANDIDIIDNGKLLLGTHDDLQLFHASNASYIKASNHNLHLDSGTTSAIKIISGGSTTYGTMANFNTDGSVDLYYDGSKKFETTSAGVSVTGTFTASSTVNAGGHFKTNSDWNGFVCGAGDDLKIYHDGTDSKIYNSSATPLKIQNVGSNGATVHIQARPDEEGIKLLNNSGASKVELYYDNSKRFETSSEGANIYGPTNTTAVFKVIGTEARSAEIRLIADDGDDFTDTVRLHQSINGNFYLQNATASGTWESMLIAVPNGAVELYYDQSKQVETVSTGIKLNDSKRVHFGSDNDAYITHDNQHLYIQNYKNNTYIQAPNMVALSSTETNGSAQEHGVKYIRNGAVQLYYDNDKKFETASAGNKITQANSGDAGGALKINTDLNNYGTINVRDYNHTWISALQVENNSSGSNETNRIIRSVNLGSANWAHASYEAKSHRFRISGGTDSSNKVQIDTDGLKFNNDQAAANALDDYEEGTWIPTVTYSGGGGATLIEQKGFYTKIGRQVHCQCAVSASSKGGGSGNMQINGLPFTSSSTVGMRHNGIMPYISQFSGVLGHPVLYNSGATTSIFVYHINSSSSASAIANITRNHLNDTFAFRAHFMFYV